MTLFSNFDYGFVMVVSTIIWLCILWIFDPLKIADSPRLRGVLGTVAYAGIALIAGLLWQFVVVALFVLWPLALYRKKLDKPKDQYHLLVVYGDIEPTVFGPYATFNEMIQSIPRVPRDQEDDGMYYLIQSGQTLKAENFSGNELEKFYGAADGSDDVDPQFPSNRLYL